MFDDDPQDLEDVIERQRARIEALIEVLVGIGFEPDELSELLVN